MLVGTLVGIPASFLRKALIRLSVLVIAFSFVFYRLSVSVRNMRPSTRCGRCILAVGW